MKPNFVDFIKLDVRICILDWTGSSGEITYALCKGRRHPVACRVYCVRRHYCYYAQLVFGAETFVPLNLPWALIQTSSNRASTRPASLTPIRWSTKLFVVSYHELLSIDTYPLTCLLATVQNGMLTASFTIAHIVSFLASVCHFSPSPLG